MSTASELIRKDILAGLESAFEKGTLPEIQVDDAAIERPQNPEHGNFACSLPLKLAKPFKMNPLAIAKALTENLPTNGVIGNASVVAPGFINITLDRRWVLDQVHWIRDNPETFSDISIGKGKSVQVEYVSANPTGRLHIAHARGAVIGSTLSELLRTAGYIVQEEYYLNDAGNQIDNFDISLLTRYRQLCGECVVLPEGAYPGEDIIDVAQKILDRDGHRYLKMPEEEARSAIGIAGTPLILEGISQDISSLRIQFDNWFSEKSLFKAGQFQKCIKILNDKGFVEKKDGATWLISSELGEEKDNVLIRRTGAPTYFATDIAYHFNKFQERRFDRVIDIWGADHQGQVSRLKSALAALGTNPDDLDMVLVQMVRFKKGKTAEKLSKRSGNVIPLLELVNEVGADACRFMFLSRSHDSQLEFDLDLAKENSSENPVYYVQYAHARICSILRLATSKGISFDEGESNRLGEPSELNLINKMLELPDVVETSVRNLEPHHLPHYALELATCFHLFYQNCRVISSHASDIPLTKSRLMLVDAARIVLKKSLDLMKMTAPEKM